MQNIFVPRFSRFVGKFPRGKHVEIEKVAPTRSVIVNPFIFLLRRSYKPKTSNFAALSFWTLKKRLDSSKLVFDKLFSRLTNAVEGPLQYVNVKKCQTRKYRYLLMSVSKSALKYRTALTLINCTSFFNTLYEKQCQANSVNYQYSIAGKPAK